MKTRAFGQVLLFFYTCVLLEEIDKVALAFKKVRPTFDFSQLAETLKEVCQKIPNIKEAVKTIVNEFEKKRKERAKKLAHILPNFPKILTICNLNGELIYLYYALKEMGKEAIFFVSETRPYLQGTRLTLWELNQASIPAKLLCDNQAAILMEGGQINCVITGSDRSNKNGDIINKIGTYALARLSHYFHIPFYVLMQYPREIEIETILIEERPQKEVFMWLKERNPFPEAIYPAFDITPAKFISGWIDISGEVRCI
jgi:methylthioribose-1-phosphate isomerase